MTLFRTTLIAMIALIIAFTIMALHQEGLDLVTPFLTPVFAMTWQGQFNVDFSSYLVLSGIWMAWRSGFSKGGILLGICAPPLGILFFAPYLLYLLAKTNGDPKKLLLGVHA